MQRRHDVDLGGADHLGDTQLLRISIEFFRRADLQQLSIHHDSDAVRHRHRFRLIVSDVDERDAKAAVQAP